MDEIGVGEGELVEGGVYDVQVRARNPKGEGIGKINDIIVFVQNAKMRIGKIYKVKITKIYRTFAYAEPLESSKYFIGNGTLIIQ